jgi:hypothetical protein
VIATQCNGLTVEEPLVSAEPCLNRPAGNTVNDGHVGQSLNTVPGAGDVAAAA